MSFNNEEKPLLLRTRNTVIVALRLIVFAIIYLIILQERGLKHLPPAFWIITGVFVISEFVYLLEQRAYFFIQRILAWIFLFDAVLIGFIIYFMSIKSTQLFIAYFAVIAIAAISKSVRASFIITFLISVFYLFISLQQGDFVFTEFITRPLFFFGVAIFASYLSEESLAHRKEQKKAERMTENIPYVGTYQSTLKGDFVYANEAFAKMLEYDSAEELRGVKVITLYKNADDRNRLLEGFKKDGQVNGFETELLTKTGKTRNVLINGILDGEIISGINMDITERKKAEDALRESQRQIGFILGAAKTTLDIVDSEFNLRYVDPERAKTSGDWTGRKCYDYYMGRSRPCPTCNLSKVFETKQILVTEGSLMRDSNTATHVTSIPYQDKNGEWLVAQVNVDVTERKKAEETLRNSEAQLSNAIKIARLGPWEYDVVNDLFRFNDSFYEIFRTTAKQVGGYTMPSADYAKRFVHPDDAEVVGMEVRKAIETDDPNFNRQLEHRIIYADGKTGYITVRFFIVKDNNGRTIRTYGVNQDITDRKQAENALLESQRQIEFILGAAKTTLDIVDGEFNLRYVDPECAKIRGDWTGRKCYDYYIGRNEPCPTCDIIKVFETKQISVTEGSLVENSAIHTHATNIPYQDKNGEWLVAQICVDITERKKMEDELKMRSLLLDNTIDTIFLHDFEGKFFYVNKAAYETRGYTKEEFMALNLSQLDTPEHAKLIKPRMQQITEKGSLTFESAHICKDGSIMPVEVHASTIELDNKKYLLTAIRDMTERKQANEELQQRNDIQTAVNLLLQLSLKDISLEQILKDTLNLIISIPWLSLQSKGCISLLEDSFLVMKVQNGIPEILQKICSRIPLGKCVCGKAALTKEIQFTNRVDKTHEISYEGIAPHGHYCVPVIYAGEVLGVINLYLKEGHLRSQKEEQFLTAIANALAGIIIRKRAETELTENRTYLQHLLDNIQEGIAILDEETHSIVDINHVTSSLIGLPREQIVGKVCHKFMCPAEKGKCPITDLKQKIDMSEKVILRADGVRIPVIKTVVPIVLNNRRYLLESFMDITKRKQMEESLRLSEEKYRTIIENTADIIYSTTLEGVITFVSPQTIAYGYAPEDIIGQHIAKFIHPDDIEKALSDFQKALQTGEMFLVSFRLLKKNGSFIYAEEIGKTIKSPDGTVNYLGVIRDITKQKHLENELIQAQKMEAVGRLAGGIAHDFNNIMAVINGYSTLILDSLKEDNPVRSDIEQIKKAGEKAAALTQQLLSFGRKQMIRTQVISLTALIGDMEKMLKPIIGENIKLVTIMGKKLANINADQSQIEQVIMNMVINARDAMPEGGTLSIKTENISLDTDSIKVIPESRSGEFIRLSIQDTGIGMDKKTMEHAFEPFFTTKERGKGTGLGLATVYGIVKQHQGWINVYSEPGKGTVFNIYLPVTRGQEEEKPVAKTDTTSSNTPDSIEVSALPDKSSKSQDRPFDGTQGKPFTDAQGKRILLVEDEESVREFILRILTKNGYQVFKAETAEEALDIFNREKGNFDLIFSDIVLPDKNGVQMMLEFLTMKPGLNVIFSSGYADEKSQWPVIQERGFKFIQKPYTTPELLRMIKETIKM